MAVIPVTSYRGQQGLLRREVWPSITYADVFVSLGGVAVPADGVTEISWAAAGLATRPTTPELIPHGRRRLGWCINPSSVEGGALRILVSDAGGVVGQSFFWRVFPLYGGGVDLNIEDGIMLPPWEITLSIINHDLGAPQTFTGYLWMES